MCLLGDKRQLPATSCTCNAIALRRFGGRAQPFTQARRGRLVVNSGPLVGTQIYMLSAAMFLQKSEQPRAITHKLIEMNEGSLFFLLAGAVHLFHLLKYGLSVVLIFVGLKMAWLNSLFNGHFPILLSLGIILGVIGASIVLSLVFPKKPDEQPAA